MNFVSQKFRTLDSRKIIELIFFFVIFSLLVLLRYHLYPFRSGDFNSFQAPWFEQIDVSSFHSAFVNLKSNYFPPYLYMLALLKWVGFAALPAVKLASGVGDILIFLLLFKLTKSFGSSNRKSMLTAFGILALPTVTMNSALWGQCDATYVAFLIGMICCVKLRRPCLAMLFFGVALAFKAQAVFLVPLIFLLYCEKQIRFSSLLMIPITHALCMLPSFFMGKSVQEVYGMFYQQANYYKLLELNAPSIYQFLPEINYEMQSAAGVASAAAIVLTVVLWIRSDTKLQSITSERLMAVAVFFSILCPFLLPKMHDRYFYLADVLSVAAFCISPSRGRFCVALLVQGGSLISYNAYFGEKSVPLTAAAFLMLVALALQSMLLFGKKENSELADPA